jgi:1-deoxy-D-xylulose-5-phosphate synthase
MANLGLLDNGIKIRSMHLPDLFQDHDSQDKQYAEAELCADDIVRMVLK